MVYNFADGLQRLQTACLLCQCRITRKTVFGLCHHCHGSLPWITTACQRCGIPLPVSQPACGRCLEQRPAFDVTVAPLAYTGAVIPLVHRFKTGHSNALRHLLVQALQTQLPPQPVVDRVLPVPMHWRRNLQRSNNHSTLLARQLAANLGVVLDERSLQRNQAGIAQKTLDVHERRRNLERAFTCTASLHNLRIALVDDVMTTGSTLDAAAGLLKQAGAREVHCWVIARTPKWLD